jgi:glycosyltransferase involved in cell wall biosynthesis
VLFANPWAAPYELVIVDDGSQDDTGKIADALAQKHPTTRVVHHAVNQGLGAALRTGFGASKGQFVSWMSADGEIPVSHILDLLRVAGDDVDMVVSGVRMRDGVVAWYREVFSSTLGLLSRVLLGFDWHQITGIYVIKGDFLHQIQLHSNTGMVNAEVFLQSNQHRLRIKMGVPLEARKRLGGTSKVTNLPTIVKTFVDLLKLRWVVYKKGAHE